MPRAEICLDCNSLYPPPSDGTRAYGRCPKCRAEYHKRKPRGKHRDTPERSLIQAFYRSTAWSNARRATIARDQACTQCGTRESLSVHHLVSIRDAPELALDQDNLTTLCRSCHGTLENTTKRRRRA